MTKNMRINMTPITVGEDIIVLMLEAMTSIGVMMRSTRRTAKVSRGVHLE